MDLGQHAAGAAAAVCFDSPEGGVKDTVEGGEFLNQIGGEGVEGLGRHDQEAFAGAVVNLQHVTGKAVHLVGCDGDE